MDRRSRFSIARRASNRGVVIGGARNAGEGSLALRYAVAGGVFGIGAPAGALLLRVLAGARVGEDLRGHAFFYAYQLIGTSVVFAVLGYLAGRRADRLRNGRDQYRKLSEKDSLTNLVNARTFSQPLRPGAGARGPVRRARLPLLIDVDQLKALNDELGHSFGSATLVHVARAIERSKRVVDVAARWGGDEFTVLMPGAGGEAALRQARAILETLSHEPVRVEGRERLVSATIGLATSASGASEDLFETADRALYAGKRAGRGQVRSAEP